MPVKAPRPVVVAPVYSWTGFYIGGDIGYGSGRSDGVLNDGTFNVGAVPYSADPRGMIGGGFAGYNYQIGQFCCRRREQTGRPRTYLARALGLFS